MLISIKNETHPMELAIVSQMLTNELKEWNFAPTRFSDTELRCEVPNEKWFEAVKEAVEFMSECDVEKVGEQ